MPHQTFPPLLQLAQSARSYSPTPVLIWVGVLIACTVVLGAAIMVLRKKMLEKQTASNVSGSLMEHLRDARARGEISEAEYEQARKAMASRISQMLDTKRSNGLFELPDTKRKTLRPVSRVGKPFGPDETELPIPKGPGTDERRAPPGYDLTGAPLPPPATPE